MLNDFFSFLRESLADQENYIQDFFVTVVRYLRIDGKSVEEVFLVFAFL